jgi:hypothetical protein
MHLTREEQILDAAKSIAAATAALVKSASAAQKELVAQGKVGYCNVLGNSENSNCLLRNNNTITVLQKCRNVN